MENKQEISDNLASWDDRAKAHVNGVYGNLKAYIKNPKAITGTVKRNLEVLRPFLPNQSIRGQRLLHLQCHIGTDTISWTRLGAK